MTRKRLNLFCWFFFYAFLLANNVKCLPLIQSNAALHTDPELTAGKFEGDILLTAAQELILKQPLQTRNGLIAETKRWPNNIIFYKIEGNFDNLHKAAILRGIQQLESATCLRFQEANETQAHFVAITSDAGGCYTAVGYQRKKQQMNLEIYPIGEGCFRPGTILHEFMHAIGFYHQQSAADRDDYIDVIYDNIVPGKEFNFEKYSDTKVTDFDVGYDYDSCLHYRSDAFSINKQDTIVPKDPKAIIGQRRGLSKKDIDKINLMYKCPIEMRIIKV